MCRPTRRSAATTGVPLALWAAAAIATATTARAQATQPTTPAQAARATPRSAELTAPSPAHGSPRLNLLLLAIDTLRADHLGCYGYGRPVSPNIDALARDGLRFERALSASPWTLPSFATMLTGRYPTRHGAGLTGPVRNLAASMPQAVTADAPTLAETLQSSGWRTCGIASNPYLLFGIERGFQRFTCKFLSADRVGALTRQWLARQRSGEPFFLFVHFNDPHEPTDPPREMLRAVGAGSAWRDPHRESLERWGGRPGDATYLGQQESAAAAGDLVRTKLALYDASILQVDLEIGLIVRQLERQGLLDRTLIVVVSDHGEEFLEHAAEGRAAALDPRGVWGIGHGHSLFDELVRVPLILHGPGLDGLGFGAQSAGSAKVIPQQFPLTELMPTLLGWLGAQPPAGMDGSDRREWLADPQRAAIPGAVEAIAYGPDLIGYSDGTRKLIAQRIGPLLWGFDLQRDPAERRDLIHIAPRDSLLDLQQALRAWNDSMVAGAPTPAAATMTAEMERALRALGYVQ